MNEALKKNEKYIKKYMSKHQMLTVLLNKGNDEDIIKFLWNQDNRSEVVRKAIREYMSKHGK
jgi:metal-responsive CopG/Arc/MetJ family transcriptional regulator